jgi:hypothetical protein
MSDICIRQTKQVNFFIVKKMKLRGTGKFLVIFFALFDN